MTDEQTPPESPTRFNWKKIATGSVIAVYALVGLAAVAMYGLEKAYAERVYPGVTLAGVDFSGKKLEEATAQVEQILAKLADITVPIAVEDGTTLEPTLTELGVEFDKDVVVTNLVAVGHGTSPWQGLVAAARSITVGNTVPLATTFNQEVLEKYVDTTTASLAKKSQNAVLTVENGEVKITPSQVGEEADPDFLRESILTRLNNLQLSGGTTQLPQVTLEITRSTPDITDADVAGVQQQAQTMIGEPITMEFEGKTYTFTKADIGSWLAFKEVDKDGGKTYDPVFEDAKINGSIAAKVAKPIDIKMAPKRILITTGQVIDEGRDGRNLDRAKLLGDIKRSLAAKTRQQLVLGVSDVPKTEQQVYPDFTLGLYEGRYVEVNLAKQRMYAIEGNTLVNEFLISSGAEWGGYSTPTGTWYIFNKHGKPYSRPYALWMPYWNGLAKAPDGQGYDGYGIHELPCFNITCTRREGISHLGTPVSHGCIRLGHNGPAAFIYDWAPIGTPVYIHR